MTTTMKNVPTASSPSDDRAARQSKEKAEKLSLLERAFPQNVHDVERVIRFVLGLALISMIIIGPKTSWGYLGLIFMFTAAQGSCPLYTLFGFSTCKANAH